MKKMCPDCKGHGGWLMPIFFQYRPAIGRTWVKCKRCKGTGKIENGQ